MLENTYTRIKVASGNAYYCRATIAGIDVVSPALSAGGVLINRVRYFARGVYTLAPKYRGIQDVYAYRKNCDGPTDNARRKLRAEIAEAAGVYAQDAETMREHYREALIGIARSKDREADNLHSEAYDLQGEADDIRDQVAALLFGTGELDSARLDALING